MGGSAPPPTPMSYQNANLGRLLQISGGTNFVIYHYILIPGGIKLIYDHYSLILGGASG